MGLGWQLSNNHKSNYSLKDLVHDGIVTTADTVLNSKGDFAYQYGGLCVGNQFSLSFKTRVRPRLDATLAQQIYFQSFTDPAISLQQFTGNSYASGFQGNYKSADNVAHSFADYSQELSMHTIFNDWKVVRIKYGPDKIFVYVNDTLRSSISYAVNSGELDGFNMSGWSESILEHDWVKVLRAAGAIVWEEDFNDYTNFSKPSLDLICQQIGCCSGFQAFYNARFNTNYSYAELLDMYKRNCNVYFEPCGSLPGPTLCGEVDGAFPSVKLADLSPCADSLLFSVGTGTKLNDAYQDSLRDSFNNKYLEKCLAARYIESFTITAPVSEYHYTLYYYDQVGNLVKTVPPAGGYWRA